jgi:hypothetical protein
MGLTSEQLFEATHPSVVPGSLVDMADAHRLFSRFPEYESAIHWIESFVMKPDPRLMRPGHVCPRLLPAVRRNLVKIQAFRSAGESVESVWAMVRSLIDQFSALFPEPRERQMGALLAIFPDIEPHRATEYIDGGHRALRMEFVRNGLMLGEFHAASEVASVRNPELLVMRCPVPMFAVRALSPHELLFLDTPDRSAQERSRYLRYYLEHLGPELASDDRRAISDRVERLEREEGCVDE